MAHNPELEPKHHVFFELFGQRPLTRYKDYRKNIKVDLIKHDDRDAMLKGTYDFCKSSWSEDGKESERATEEEMQFALKSMFEGKALGLGLETVNFMFRISGITRIDTHQIVRQRVGVTFSQQCTGDRMLHHNDVLVEESFNQFPEILQGFYDSTNKAKMVYAEMNDNPALSLQAARSIIPHNLETFIFMNVNLMTLLFFHQKRIDDGSQTWQINYIAQQMADRVCEIYPEMKEVFEKNKKKFQFQRQASADRKNVFSTSLYIPNEDEFEYHDRDFLYPYTKEEMHYTGTPIDDTYYWGYEEITKDQWETIKKAYKGLDAEIKKNHWTNEEILQKGRDLTAKLENEIF